MKSANIRTFLYLFAVILLAPLAMSMVAGYMGMSLREAFECWCREEGHMTHGAPGGHGGQDAAAKPTGRAYTRFVNYDAGGNDLNNGGNNVQASQDACEASCDSTANCVGSAWNKENRQCWLKGKIGPMGPNAVAQLSVANSPAGQPAISNSILTWGSGKALDCNGGVCGQGVKVQSWDKNGGAGQRWTLKDGTLQSSGFCLDVKSNATNNGAIVQSWGCNGSGGQQWQPKWTGSGTVLVNPMSNRCLDVPSSSTANGAQMQLWDCNGSGAQLWKPE